MKIPVITYHSVNVNGFEYSNNDHIALEKDLEFIFEHGIQVLSLDELYLWRIGQLKLDSSRKYVAITFDDGSELDFYDWNHPKYGMVKSFFNCLNNYPNLQATSFVIACPKARKTLETTCLAGYELWSDQWWQKAEDSKQISIENHSWDHLHPTLDVVSHSKNLKGDFSQVLIFEDAESQITDANHYIESIVTNKSVSYFAYPEGKYSPYLINDYFPNQQSKIKAAFSCEASYVTADSNLWCMPRFVCGHDWKSLKEFKEIVS